MEKVTRLLRPANDAARAGIAQPGTPETDADPRNPNGKPLVVIDGGKEPQPTP